MIKKFATTVLLFSLFAGFISCGKSDKIMLFDGESFSGWEGSKTVFRIENEAIVGGNLKNPMQDSYYLCTEQEYENFELRVKVKFISTHEMTNGGISFRASRVPNSNEVKSYQADIGYIDAIAIANFSDFTPRDTTGIYPLWGSLVDECRPDTSRYPRPDIFPVRILKVADKDLIEETIDPNGWNEVYIKANGPDIEIKLNGVTTAKFTETDDIPTTGSICLQAHSGGPFEVWYKNVELKPLD